MPTSEPGKCWEPRLDRRLDDLVNERRHLADLYQAGLIDIIEMPASARLG
jgi:hypothetical protein